MTGCHSLKNRSLRHAEYIDHNFYSDKIINVVTFRDRLTAGQVTLDHLIVVRIHVPEIIKKRRFSVFFCAQNEIAADSHDSHFRRKCSLVLPVRVSSSVRLVPLANG